MKCPQCQKIMEGRGNTYRCCSYKYQVRFICEKCGSEPEEISSCGSVGYLCRTCNELKSRQRMQKEFVSSEKE